MSEKLVIEFLASVVAIFAIIIAILMRACARMDRERRDVLHELALAHERLSARGTLTPEEFGRAFERALEPDAE